MALKFAPFGSDIELPFYTALSNFKIDVDKLDDSARPVLGLYEPRLTPKPADSCRMQVLGNALTSKEYVEHAKMRLLSLTATGFPQVMFEPRVRSRM